MDEHSPLLAAACLHAPHCTVPTVRVGMRVSAFVMKKWSVGKQSAELLLVDAMAFILCNTVLTAFPSIVFVT